MEANSFYKAIIYAIIIYLSWIKNEVSGYRILGLFPYNGRSHIKMFEEIMKELAIRGHTVHMVSHYPLEKPPANFTHLSIEGSIPLPNNQLNFNLFERMKPTDVLEMAALFNMVIEHENVMKAQVIQKLLKSKETYDLIITESFTVDMTLGFVHKFKAPFIFLSSCPPPLWTNQLFANPTNPAYIPHFLSSFNDKMTFFERLKNTIELNVILALWNSLFVSTSEKMMRQYFGDEVPPLLEIAKNASLLLTNSHFTVTGVKPAVPSIIEIGGVHIEPVKKLPSDIEMFIENSPNGVIYFCMGSLLRAATWTEEKKVAFINAFSQIKQRVLWKFEDESVTYSKNIMIKKWMPQRDILAHPKVKLFISHGGLLGTLEAISAGKPILAIPMFGDQKTNSRSLEAKGVAKCLNYKDINNQTVLEHIEEILKPQYAQNAERLSKEFHDRPMRPMDTAIFWIEYVIRHKGARHLRSAAVDLPFYKYLLLDVLAFILVITIFVILALKKCILIFRKSGPNSERKKEKKH